MFFYCHTLDTVFMVLLSLCIGFSQHILNPAAGGCRIHQLHHCRGVRLSQKVSWIIKQSDGEGLVMLELQGMQSATSLPLLPGPFWPGVVVPDRVLSMGQIELIGI